MTRVFWDWAVAAYAAPGVSEACLTLQDHHGQNVPLLLWSGWCAASGRRPDEETIEAACDIARAWEENAVAPLRAVRRTLKTVVPDMDAAARLAVREQVKTAEVAAERALMDELEALAPSPGGAPRPTLEALVQVSRQWSPVTPRPALARLSEALSA